MKTPRLQTERTQPCCKSPSGPKLISSITLVLNLKEKTLRVAEDREEQTPGAPRPCTIMHLGCIFSPARNSVWVCAFLVWKVHKGQNSRFAFLSPTPSLPHPEEKFHQPRIWPERKQLGTRAPENSSLSITEEAAAASHTQSQPSFLSSRSWRGPRPHSTVIPALPLLFTDPK